MTQIVHSKHPLLPDKDREIHQVVVQEGETLETLFTRYNIDFNDKNHPLAVQINGKPVSRIDFGTLTLNQHDLVTVHSTVAGNGSNPLQIVLMIVVLVVAYYTGQWELVSQYGTAASAAATAAVTIAGSLILNSIFGPMVKSPGGNSTSPTYSIAGAQNSARIGQPMPIAMGYNKIVPDAGASPFVQFVGNQQYLYQVFNFGLGTYDMAELEVNLKIGDTPITAYQNVTTEWSGADGKLTLFPGNVFTDTTQISITYAEGAITRTTSEVGCTMIGIDFGGDLYHVDSSGNLQNLSVYIDITYRQTGTTGPWLPFNPTPVNSTSLRASGVGSYTESGLYSGYDGYSSQVIITNGSSTPVRVSYELAVPLGQYDVKIQRVSQDYDPDTDTSDIADISLIGLRSYQPDNADYTGQTRLAVRILATGQLNGAIATLSSVAHTQCPVYNSGTNTWTTQNTSNPAWWYLWMARGGKNPTTGQRMWGYGADDSKIDIDTIIEWGAWCDANSLQFNFVLDQPQTIADSLNQIARCGRGAMTYQKGVLGVIYDLEGQAPVQMFGMANIKAGSFQVTYASSSLVEQIVVQFINPDLDWQQDQVYVNIPGVDAPEYSTTVTIPGITSKTQAAQEANLLAAAQQYFRRTVTFETDIEGVVCARNDVIQLTHDMTSWSDSGRLASGSSNILVLDKAVTGTSGDQPYLSIRQPNGAITTAEVVPFSTTTNTLTLVEALDFSPNADTTNNPQDYTWQFNPLATPGRTFKVIEVTPSSANARTVKITCREETADYYNAINGDFNYTAPTLLNQITPEVSNISFSEFTTTGIPGTQVTISWTNTNAVGARLQIAQGAGASVDYGIINSNQYTFTVLVPTTLSVSLTPVALVQAAGTTQTPVTAVYVMKGVTQIAPEDISALVPNVNGLSLANDPGGDTFTGQNAVFTWRVTSTAAPEVGSEPNGGDSGVLNPYFKDYIITILNDDDTVRRTEKTVDQTYTYTFEKNMEDGNGTPARSFIITVQAEGQQGQLSVTTAKLAVSNPAPLMPTNIQFSGGFTTVGITFDPPTDTDYAGMLIYYDTDSAYTYSMCRNKLDTTGSNFSITGLTAGDTYYFYLVPYDTFGKDPVLDSLNISSQYTCATVLIQAVDLGPGSVTANAIAAAAIATAAIQPAAITASLIAAGAVLNVALAANAVATGNIQSAAITNALIAANAVHTVNINTGAITTALIASGAVTGANIAANTVTASNIVSGTITSTQIAASTILGSNIAANTITGGLIAASTITASNIVAGTITATQIAANTITATQIAANTITAAQILAGTITATQIAASTIIASNIAASTITASQIAASTILGTNIAAATITGSLIQANAITTGHIQANAITSVQIAAGAVTTSALSVLSASGTTIDMSQGIVTYNNGTVMRVQGTGFGTASQFVDWFGPSMATNLCSELNATYYMKTNGDTYNGGYVAIDGLLQSSYANISGYQYYATIPSSFSCPTQISNGRTKTVSFSINIPSHSDNYSSGTNPGDGTGISTATWTLQRSFNGGSWSTLTSWTTTQYVGNDWDGETSHTGQWTSNGMTGSWTFNDTATTAGRYQYQILLSFTPSISSPSPGSTLGDGAVYLSTSEPTS